MRSTPHQISDKVTPNFRQNQKIDKFKKIQTHPNKPKTLDKRNSDKFRLKFKQVQTKIQTRSEKSDKFKPKFRQNQKK